MTGTTEPHTPAPHRRGGLVVACGVCHEDLPFTINGRTRLSAASIESWWEQCPECGTEYAVDLTSVWQ